MCFGFWGVFFLFFSFTNVRTPFRTCLEKKRKILNLNEVVIHSNRLAFRLNRVSISSKQNSAFVQTSTASFKWSKVLRLLCLDELLLCLDELLLCLDEMLVCSDGLLLCSRLFLCVVVVGFFWGFFVLFFLRHVLKGVPYKSLFASPFVCLLIRIKNSVSTSPTLHPPSSDSAVIIPFKGVPWPSAAINCNTLRVKS